MNLLQIKKRNIIFNYINSMNINLKAVTIGDIKGIGIEILIDLWKKKNKELFPFILITNLSLFNKFLSKNKYKIDILQIKKIENIKKIQKNKFLVFDIKAKNNDQNTYNSILKAYELTKKNQCKSIITLPINKEKISKKIDKNFLGHTELFKKLDKKNEVNMFFYNKKIIVVTLTTHIPIKDVPNFFKSKNKIFNKICLINDTLKKDFNIKKPKLIIAGINPHSGENGLIGKEELNFLNPTIKKLKKYGINIEGPFSGDTLFTKTNIKKYDCFICNFHDQALIPFKLISNFEGVNFTGSLDIIRTSPDHGPAYDIVGKKIAKKNSLFETFALTNKIYNNRNKR